MSDRETLLAERLVEEYTRLLEEGWEPDAEEFLRRVPDEHRDACRGRIQELTENHISVQIVQDENTTREEAPPPSPVELSDEAALFVEEYRRIVDDGYNPDPEEYLGRIPDELRDQVREGIASAPPRASVVRSAADELMAPAVPPPAAEPEAEAEAEPEPEPEPVSRLLYPDFDSQKPPAVYDEAPDAYAPVEPDALFDGEAAALESEPAPVAPEAYLEAEPEPDYAPEPEAEAPAAEAPVAGGLPALPGFVFETLLGSGTLGDVYAAYDESQECDVAVKLLRPECLGRARQRVVADAGKAVEIDHRAIARVHSVAQVDGAPVIGMEKVEGFPIDVAARKLDERQQAKLLYEVACGLSAAHDQGLLHGNLTPGNVLVTPGLQPKIVDFGVAVSLREAPDGVEVRPDYLSPEQTTAMRIGPASDIFAFGAVMYAVLTGRPPFEGDNTAEVLFKIANEDPPFPRDYAPGVSRDLQGICLACLARNPRRRPSARELVTDLTRFLSGEPSRLQPARYRDAIDNSVNEQRTALATWAEQGIVSQQDCDRLDTVLRGLLGADEGRRLSVPQALLYTSACSAVLGTLLVAVYGAVPGLLGWALPALAASVFIAAGAVARVRGEMVGATALLAAGAAALVPAALTGMRAFGMLAGGPAFLGSAYGCVQVMAACGAGAAGALVFGAWLRRAAFAWLTAGLAAIAWTAFLPWWGVAGSTAAYALWFLPLTVLALPALHFERRGRADWAAPFHLVALAALVVAPVVMAVGGGTFQVLGIDHVVRAPRDAYLGFTVHGLVLLALMLVLERLPSLDLRRAARLFETIVPALLVGSLYGAALANGAGADVVLHFAAAGLLLGLAPWRNRRRFLLGGLAGLALGGHLLIRLGIVGAAPLAIGFTLVGVALALAAYFQLRRAR